MLHLYQSNQLETLSDALNRILLIPLDNPLQADEVVVQNQGMARWLSQQIAEISGIAANLKFPLPASFIWELFDQTLDQPADISAFRPEIMLWRILGQLQGCSDIPSMHKISAYLEQDPDGRKTFQLAQKVAELFDQYLVYRPAMILAWEQGRVAADAEHQWQASLWNRLNPEHDPHWASLLHRFHQASEAGTLNTGQLPQRICFFGIGALAPAYLEVLKTISRYTDVHLFQLSPCETYWDDLLPERILAIKRKTWREHPQAFSDYFSSGNPLLASMGLSGQEFAKLTADINPYQVDLYASPNPDTLLSQIQADILNAEDGALRDTQPVYADEPSIQFHRCHSPMREIQVLHNRLLDMFNADPELKPADILVMAPDIDAYAPLISSVFDSTPPELSLPWSMTDLSGQRGDPVIEAFSQLLEFPDNRYTASEVMALLENPAIMSNFGFQPEHLPQIRHSIHQAGARWGLDRQQRQQQGLEDSTIHSWEFAIERLLMAYVTGPLTTPVNAILPCGGELNQTAPWLGNLCDFLRALQALHHRIYQLQARPGQWLKIMQQLLGDFFRLTEDEAHQTGLRKVREALLNFDTHCQLAQYDQPLSLQVVRQHLLSRLSAPQAHQGFLRGSINFCKMTAMRALPFKVIWLLGMNDTSYPRSQHPASFDLIEARLELGDRSRRDSDHYLFLETLLSTRRQLSISWLGRHPKTNDELPVSVVVAELRDYIDRIQPQSDSQTASEKLTHSHPLQAFSSRCFNGNPASSSYAAQWLPAIGDTGPQVFSPAPLPAIKPPLETLDSRELLRFWQHPVRYFAQQRLGLNVWLDDTQLEEAEAFSLDGLDKYRLNAQLLGSILDNQDPETAILSLQAGGELPRGAFGQIIYQHMQTEAQSLIERIEPYTQAPRKRLEIDLDIGDLRLNGYLDGIDNSGQSSYRLANYKGSDLLQLWIRHLLFMLCDPPHIELTSRHFAKDKTLKFQQVDDPLNELKPFLETYQQGMNQALHFFPKSSFARIKALNGKKPESANKAARNVWRNNPYNRGEESELAYQICFQGLAEHEILDTQFEQLSELYQSAYQHLEID